MTVIPFDARLPGFGTAQDRVASRPFRPQHNTPDVVEVVAGVDVLPAPSPVLELAAATSVDDVRPSSSSSSSVMPSVVGSPAMAKRLKDESPPHVSLASPAQS